MPELELPADDPRESASGALPGADGTSSHGARATGGDVLAHHSHCGNPRVAEIRAGLARVEMNRQRGVFSRIDDLGVYANGRAIEHDPYADLAYLAARTAELEERLNRASMAERNAIRLLGEREQALKNVETQLREARATIAELEREKPKYDPEDFAENFDDLPDGAFFALADEMGLEPEDFIPEDEEKDDEG